MKILLSKIRPNIKPIRYESTDMDSLIDSIKRHGLVVPPKVRANGKNYELVYGHRRLQAARAAGLTEIECIVEELDDRKTAAQAIVENVEREDLTDLELGEALVQYREDQGYTSWEQVAADFGHGQTWALERASLLNMPEPIKQAVKSGDVTTKHIREIHAGTKTRPGEFDITPIVSKVAQEGLSKRQARQVAEAYAEADEAGREWILSEPYKPESVTRAEISQEVRAKTENERKSQRYYDQLADGAFVRDWLKDAARSLASIEEGAERGKLSPDAKKFFARKLKAVANDIAVLVEGLNG